MCQGQPLRALKSLDINIVLTSFNTEASYSLGGIFCMFDPAAVFRCKNHMKSFSEALCKKMHFAVYNIFTLLEVVRHYNRSEEGCGDAIKVYIHSRNRKCLIMALLWHVVCIRLG